MPSLLRRLIVVAPLLLAACAAQPFDPEAPRDPIGDFRMGHNIVVANAPQQGPFSRDVTDEEWEAALTQAIETRLRGYSGTGLYHVGVKVEAYVAARSGVPVVYSPRSILLLAVNVYDNRTGQRLNADPHRLTVYESTTGGSAVLGSGLTRAREDQIAGLSANAAEALEAWLKENAAWFDREPVEGEPVPYPAAAATPAGATPAATTPAAPTPAVPPA
ncbi:MAG: hypothetical protein MUF73_16105 [Rhodobacteraceae bacterium]|jgi:hypothetical protein|nr:hypothetical protein [Paracoccaceae bacterium]